MARLVTHSAQHTDALLREVVRLFTQAQGMLTECCRGATARECEALLVLGAHTGPLTVQTFGEHLHLEKTWASRLVARLEKRGLVRRVENPADGRSWLIELTARGRQSHAALERSLNDHAVALLGCVPAAERANVERALTHLRDALVRCLRDCAPNRSSSC